MARRPISNVSAGETLLIGLASIDNQARSIIVYGVGSGGVPAPLVYNLNIFIKASPVLDLSANIGSYNAKSIRFTFNGAIVQPSLTLGVQTKFGSTIVKAAAKRAEVKGIYSLATTPAIVSGYLLNKYDIDFIVPIAVTDSKNIPFHFGDIVIGSVGAGLVFKSGIATLKTAWSIKPLAIDSPYVLVNSLVLSKSEGLGPLSLNLASDIKPNEPRVRFNFGGANPISRVGSIYGGGFGLSVIKVGAPNLTPKSIPISSNPKSSLVYALNPADIHGNHAGELNAEFSRVSPNTNALNIGFYFWVDNQSTTFGHQSSLVSAPAIANAGDYIYSAAWQSSAFGRSATYNFSPTFQARPLFPESFTSQAAGSATIYNYRQYELLEGKDQSAYGAAKLLGGVWYLGHKSWQSSNVASKANVLNTTAHRYLSIKGIYKPAVGAPVVTPRIIRPAQIYGTLFGAATLIPTPELKVAGTQHTESGNTTVWFHTRPISFAGIDAYETGYPDIRDPTRYIYTPALVDSAVFGDIRARNVSAFLLPTSIDNIEISDWTEIVNEDRYLTPKGVQSLDVGGSEIYNKSPSIFFEGIEPPVFKGQFIGYRVRDVVPTGFDLLSLGRPLLTNTPQLLPAIFNGSYVSRPAVSNYFRYIDIPGLDSFETGETNILYWRRYLAPSSWLSSTYARQDLTHGLRTISNEGFLHDGYGDSWVSYGTRLLAPETIVNTSQSNHSVGRSREIVVDGYIATLFGTRIIPENIDIYPTGFAGKFGLPNAYLSLLYVKPFGYISVGTEPKDRWGDITFHNSRQYIEQNFDGGNGLVPPAWSDWTLIENRNKVMGAIGINVQKFGYSVIANTATPILPLGIQPPIAARNDVSMIAYRIRHLPIDGIEAPVTSSWGVVYNDARVVIVIGSHEEAISDPIVVSNRRYYKDVGRIDSLEMSDDAMVAYRIRTVDIEPRYSIAPPQIELPTIDLWTKYVDCTSYVSEAHGLPALSIHLRHIAPRWDQREKFGWQVVKNVTPELLAGGHSSSDFGSVAVRDQWREVFAMGDTATLFGKSYISDTKQTIEIRGWLDTVIGKIESVVRYSTNPYVLQHIYLSDESGYGRGYGIFFDPAIYGPQIPKPVVSQNILQVRGFSSLSSYGDAFVHTNNIELVGFAIRNISAQNKVHNSLSYISSAGGIYKNVELGKPRLSPHTIWAVMDAPDQAVQNHPPARLHYVNTGAVMGTPDMGDKDQLVNTYGFNRSNQSFGWNDLQLYKRYLLVHSFRFSRVGTPAIPFTLQGVVIREGAEPDKDRFGVQVVGRPPYSGPIYVAPLAIKPNVINGSEVQNLHRAIIAYGKDHLLMGESGGSNPYMWQKLRIGAHIPTAITAGDMALYGKTDIQLWIRGVEVMGFDALSTGYELSNFKERMKVVGTTEKTVFNQAVTIDGRSGSLVSKPDIRLNQHFIRPDGNSDQFRKGGYHA